jgi:hypothetical protein
MVIGCPFTSWWIVGKRSSFSDLGQNQKYDQQWIFCLFCAIYQKFVLRLNTQFDVMGHICHISKLFFGKRHRVTTDYAPTGWCKAFRIADGEHLKTGLNVRDPRCAWTLPTWDLSMVGYFLKILTIKKKYFGNFHKIASALDFNRWRSCVTNQLPWLSSALLNKTGKEGICLGRPYTKKEPAPLEPISWTIKGVTQMETQRNNSWGRIKKSNSLEFPSSKYSILFVI